MIILSKADIVERFKIARTVLTSDSRTYLTYNENNVTFDMVMFLGNNAYYTNGAFSLSAPVLDRPNEEFDVGFVYDNEENPLIQIDRRELKYDIIDDKSKVISIVNNSQLSDEDKAIQRDFVSNVNLEELIVKTREGFKTNKVIFKKNDMLQKIKELYGDQVKNKDIEALAMVPDYNRNVLICKARRFKKKDDKRASQLGEFEIPIYDDFLFSYGSTNTEDKVVTIQVKFMDLIKIFTEDEYIKMTFNMLQRDPKKRASMADLVANNVGYVNLEGYGDENPKITLTVGQVIAGFDIFE